MRIDKEICTGFIVSGKAFMSTGDCALKIDKKNLDLLAHSGCRLEVYYRTYNYGMPFITNFVSRVTQHPDYEFHDSKKKFSLHNFGIIFVSLSSSRKIFG